jgi:hypothetical protein
VFPAAFVDFIGKFSGPANKTDGTFDGTCIIAFAKSSINILVIPRAGVMYRRFFAKKHTVSAWPFDSGFGTQTGTHAN